MRFQLVRYFVAASLGIFTLVTLAIVYFEHEQSGIFKELQEQQVGFFRQVQDEFANQQDQAARRDLLKVHEAGNVNLTRLFANALWERDFAPFAAKAQNISFDHCRAMPETVGEDGKPAASGAKKDCFSEGGRHIAGLPGFRDLDAKVFGLMKKSSVYKIKVFDLRGITIYSSEHKQLGEDKRDNAGWKAARVGVPASELTHRDRFSAFEGTVENRDVISSYLPVFLPGTANVVGVFEVYSDVTPFLEQIKRTSAQIGKSAALNQQNVVAEAKAARQEADASSIRVLVIVLVLLGTLFATLFVIVRRAEAIILAQEKERASAQQQLAQAEKMATLGNMVAGVAHQLNTPLAFSQNNIQLVQQALKAMQPAMLLARMITGIVKRTEGEQATFNTAKLKATLPNIEAGFTDPAMLDRMLGDVLAGIAQINELVVHLRDFTRLDRAKTVDADLNKSLHSVVYIAKSVLPEHVVVLESFGKLPSIECNPSQLNQVFLNLINNAAEAMEGKGTIKVESAHDGDRVKVRVSDTGPGIPDDVMPHLFELYFTTKPPGEGTGLGLAIARDIVRAHGGDITVETFAGSGTTFTVSLPVKQA